MKTLRLLLIDGQNRDGSDAGETRLELWRDCSRFRWYGPDYGDDGRPAGPCVIDSGVSAATVKDAIAAARQAWSAPTWNLRRPAWG